MMTVDVSVSSSIEEKAGSRVWKPGPQRLPGDYNMRILRGWEKLWIESRAAWHIFVLAYKSYKSIRKAVSVLKALYGFKKAVLGGTQTKIVKVGRKFYHSIYAPGYPSAIFDRYIEAEFNRIAPLKQQVNKLSFAFFAITSKCPLQCEHCFEGTRLNKPESFSPGQLKAVISKIQSDGVSQFHLSGGEPLVRIKDLLQVVDAGKESSEFFVLTSGFNFTAANARALRQAGLTGVVISLDHYDPDLHDAFRGFRNSYSDVISAIKHAQDQDLVIVLTVCATKAFCTQENLTQYMELAKQLKVPFVQILEPKAVGNYAGKNVSLEQSHFDILEQFYQLMNFDPAYSEYPVIIYHGYHLRRIGCISGGNRSLYIDSEGFINACPFCQNAVVNIKDLLLQSDSCIPDSMLSMACSRYLGT